MDTPAAGWPLATGRWRQDLDPVEGESVQRGADTDLDHSRGHPHRKMGITRAEGAERRGPPAGRAVAAERRGLQAMEEGLRQERSAPTSAEQAGRVPLQLTAAVQRSNSPGTQRLPYRQAEEHPGQSAEREVPQAGPGFVTRNHVNIHRRGWTRNVSSWSGVEGRISPRTGVCLLIPT